MKMASHNLADGVFLTTQTAGSRPIFFLFLLRECRDENEMQAT